MGACPSAPSPWPGSAIFGSAPPSASPPPKPFQTWSSTFSPHRFRTRDKHRGIGRGFGPAFVRKRGGGTYRRQRRRSGARCYRPRGGGGGGGGSATAAVPTPTDFSASIQNGLEMFDGEDTPESLSNPIDDGLRLGQLQGPSLNCR